MINKGSSIESMNSEILLKDEKGKSPDSDDEEMFGYQIDELGNIAFKFMRDYEYKLFHPTYEERKYLLSLMTQAKHGPFMPEKASPLGAFDFIGRDRRQSWVNLGTKSAKECKKEFIVKIDKQCKQFRTYIETVKKEREDREMRLRQDEEKRLNEQLEMKKREQLLLDGQKRLEDVERVRDSERQILFEALNQQTYAQFKSYAEQQYPNEPDSQQTLIRKLQELHFQQYMQQIIQCQLISQMPSNVTTETINSSQTINPAINSNPSIQDQANLEITSNGLKFAHLNGHESHVCGGDSNTFQQPNSINFINNQADNKPNNCVENGEKQNQNNENEREEDEENDDREIVGPIEKATTWRYKDIKGFKEQVKKEESGGIIKVCHGEIVTLSVPTYDKGQSISWEFATDSYDIGFGVFFEWNKNPGIGVSVHISESDDEEFDRESSGKEKDVESSGERKPPKVAKPCSIIMPIYRLDCHEEVFLGCHKYPGKGVYLLKFDNSYSLWRSKTLYYRVFYDTVSV